MLIDLNDIDERHVIQADICIIGAGAAGIVLAKALRSTGYSIALLESGRLRFEERTQALYHGPVEGALFEDIPPYGPYRGRRDSLYPSRSRLRYFGGSTNHWAGYCRPLDDLDFSVRSWVPHSGWPITRSELMPYYGPAAELVQIAPFDDGKDEGRGWERGAVIFDDGRLLTKRFHLSGPTQFGSAYRRELDEASSVTVYLHANVTGIDTNEAGSAVTQLRVATLGGKRFTAEAKLFVLAVGGIENPRLLLVSNQVQKAGLGNQHDLVGRFFMEHPVWEAPESGRIIVTRPLLEASAYDIDEQRMRGVLCLSADLQRQAGLLNASVAFNFHGDLPPSVDRLGRAAARLNDLGGDEPIRGPVSSVWDLVAEQAPNPDSRVTVADEVDELGVKRASLNWKTTRLDSDSVLTTLKIIATALGTSGRGRAQVAIAEDDPWRRMLGSCHHMGTTRMSRSPSQGVVDADCRVHGLPNLYVAGSSVFPTVGHAAPTLTIVALALRLADHLKLVMEHA